jgi:ribose transport system ATP-binding protein
LKPRVVNQAPGAESGMSPDPASPVGARPVMVMDGISKAYGATIAVRSVSFEVMPGEIHAILGENGAGKSTIVKILSGTVAPDRGRLELGGEAYTPADPMAARVAGVATAFQELSLLSNLTVAQNLMLPSQIKGSSGLISRRRSGERAAGMLAEYGLGHIHPDVPIASLSLSEKQRIEIIRAVHHGRRLLILDEPTASLADPTWLFNILDRITAEGVGVIYISHRLSEVRRLCRRGTILRNGESIETASLKGVDDDRIFELMVGAVARDRRHSRRETPDGGRESALSVKNLSGGGVRDISFTIHRGEILGVAGLEGQGQRDLFRMLAGLQPAASGRIVIDGKQVEIESPAAAARAGIGFVPEERKTEGIFLGLQTEANISLSRLDLLSRFAFVNRKRERNLVDGEAQRVDLATRYLRLRIGELSGGNQQKALIGRVLGSGARHLVLFDPTRGVDVGTKAVIYNVIRHFVEAGGCALVYSTELSELVHLVDRCAVVYRGRVAGIVQGDDLNEPQLVALAAGSGALK